MFKIAICDDEKSICSMLEKIILKFKKEHNEEVNVEVFFSGYELCKYIEEYTFDLIFLDIEMEKLSGIEVGNIIRKENDDYITKIIYISGKDGYDRKLFDFQPLSFLPKPLEEKKVIENLKLAFKLSGHDETMFSYKVGRDTRRIKLKDILYFKSVEREVEIVLTENETENETERFYSTMDLVLSQVEKNNFIQIHKSFIINYSHVSKFRSDEVVMLDGSILPVAQSKRKEVKKYQLYYEVGVHAES